MQLGFGISFEDLYTRDGLVKLDSAFVSQLAGQDAPLHNRLVTARANPDALPAKDESQLLIDIAPRLEDFISELFAIRSEVAALKESMFALAPLYSCKRLFVQRKAAKSVKPEMAATFNGGALLHLLSLPHDSVQSLELAFARAVMKWMDAAQAHAPELNAATQYAAWALYSEAGIAKHACGIVFKQPRKIDPQKLIALDTELHHGVTMLKIPHHHERAREGFALTDDGGSLEKSLDEANYCIFCHNQGRDSCSTGLKEVSPRKGVEESSSTASQGNSGGSRNGGSVPPYKKSDLGIQLAGCPLEEKISEMNFLRTEGVPLGALAMIVVDNPMCAGTGHRICNDCMKSCIYQKQEPVNIPQAETRSLRDVLALPYGFEIYSLLTRWNPLDIRRPLPKPDSGKRVLVAGMGPAGYTIAHHLINDGHTVVGIDGLKIEPLPAELCGILPAGAQVPFEPIRDASALFESLDERAGMGFGGVAEYGITVRWDKNFLTVIRLLLERRKQFSLIGGVRFGSTLTTQTAWELGFDHIALCMGAGKPTLIDMPGGLARGVRTASDFLMALQLTGAARADSIANLQLRLPVVVIGGGLTAIDTSTEALAYYPVQVEKFLTRYEMLSKQKGEEAVRKAWNTEEAEIADEFINHAHALRAERAKPEPDIIALLKSWGGVTMAYRKKLTDAPSYRLNHEEVEKALEEGILIAEGLEPVGVDTDGYGHANAIRLKSADGSVITLPARAVLIAAGTQPNTVLASEQAGITLHEKYFAAVDEDGNAVKPEKSAKPAVPHVLVTKETDGRALSFFGDLHPSFAGNVVKAMGSAKQGYPVVSRILAKRNSTPQETADTFLQSVNAELRATVHAVHRLTPTIVEVVVRAPLAARMFQPGQFYRLQNFEANALKVTYPNGIAGPLNMKVAQGSEREPHAGAASPHTVLAMEGLALTGASVDNERGLLSTIVLEMGGSSDLCSHLQQGEPVILMGPTGEPTHIAKKETVLLAGGGLGNAVLFSIGKAAREQGSRVLYFAGYKKEIDRYKVKEIEDAADIVVWCCDEGKFAPSRAADKAFQGNIVEAMLAYASGLLGDVPVPMQDVNHIIAIGSDRMMQAVAKARHNVLKPYLKPGHQAIGSINSPMQCMMKEICAQCLQQHVDPVSGTISYVYSCRNQDQELDKVSFPFLDQRLRQNGTQEKLTAQWVDACLNALSLRRQAS